MKRKTKRRSEQNLSDLSDKKPVEVVCRYTQDIEIVKANVIENHVERNYCPRCDRIVTAPMTDALPRSQLGLSTVVLSAWLHFFIGVTIGNILKWFSISHLLTMSKGCLSQAWNRLAQILTPWYERGRPKTARY